MSAAPPSPPSPFPRLNRWEESPPQKTGVYSQHTRNAGALDLGTSREGGGNESLLEMGEREKGGMFALVLTHHECAAAHIIVLNTSTVVST